MKKEVIQFLRNVGNDFNDKDPTYNNFWAECEGQGDSETCAKHQDCGICRFEYMKRKGWLSPKLVREE